MQQTTFENNVAKGEIAQNDQFQHLPQCIQLFAVPSFIEIFRFFAIKLSNSSAAGLLFVGKS